MCGIMGYVGHSAAWPVVLSGLKRLEYRGYDSAGIATITGPGELGLARQVGHLSALERAFPEGLTGSIGIGHTRWATHGGVTRENAHPHIDTGRRVALVHNGIIDNAERLREELEARDDIELAGDTDSELLAELVGLELGAGATLLEAVRRALERIDGTAGVVAMAASAPGVLVAARLGSPVIVGLGDGESWVASDANALLGHTQRVVYLDDGELAEIHAGRLRTIDLANRSREHRVERINAEPDAVELGEHAHFYIKELRGQGAALARTLRGRLDPALASARLGGIEALGRRLFEFEEITLAACGTSLHAAEVGQFLLERYARIPARAEDAAELRSRNPIVKPSTLYLAISQSGETGDTLAALREIQLRGGTAAGVVNVVGSTIARDTECGIYLHAGPELSVASTKSFTTQVVALSLLTLRFARMRGMAASEGRAWCEALAGLPEAVDSMIAASDAGVAALAGQYGRAPYLMFVGRGVSWPVAREGALKFKEICYTPCDGLSGAEMKHGPIALIESGTPVWALVPPDDTRERMIGNMRELAARGAHILAVADAEDTEVAGIATAVLPLPKHHPALSPALSVIPLQLFAYHAALALGRNVDRPRNLAKSVTVE